MIHVDILHEMLHRALKVNVVGYTTLVDESGQVVNNWQHMLSFHLVYVLYDERWNIIQVIDARWTRIQICQEEILGIDLDDVIVLRAKVD